MLLYTVLCESKSAYVIALLFTFKIGTENVGSHFMIYQSDQS